MKRMGYKYFLASISVVFSQLISYSQETGRPLYSLTIVKIANHNGNRVNNVIKIDSLGNVYKNQTNMGKKVNIRQLSREITRYINKEAVSMIPGNNDIIFKEHPTPTLNEQLITVSIHFLDDFYIEANLRNKTYYSWGRNMKIDSDDYPLFKYLKKKEAKLIKKLLN